MQFAARAIIIILIFILTGIFCLPISTHAGTVAGIVRKTQGDAFVFHNGIKLPSAKGMRLYENDILVTGADGAVGLIFRDNSVITMSKNSRIVITEFKYEPADDKLSLKTKIERGAMSYMSGVIAGMKKDAVKIETPHYVTCAVRGTRVLLKVTPHWTERKTLFGD